jgi:hypothetical protein
MPEPVTPVCLTEIRLPFYQVLRLVMQVLVITIPIGLALGAMLGFVMLIFGALLRA